MESIERAWTDRLGHPCSFFDLHADWLNRIDAMGHARAHCWSNQQAYLKRDVFARRDRLVLPGAFDQMKSSGQMVWKDVPSRTMPVRCGEPIATLITRLDRVSLRRAFRVMV